MDGVGEVVDRVVEPLDLVYQLEVVWGLLWLRSRGLGLEARHRRLKISGWRWESGGVVGLLGGDRLIPRLTF